MINRPPVTLFPPRFFMKPFRFDLGGGDKAFATDGATVTVQLRKQGYLDSLLVYLTGTYTVANATLVFIQLGAYNIVKNFNLVVPEAPLPPVNAGGAMMHWWNLRNRDWSVLRQQWRFPAQGTLDANAYWAGLVDSYPTGVGAKTMTLWWVLPTHYSVDDIRGTIPLGNVQQANLLVQPAPRADFLDAPANQTLGAFTLDVVQLWLTPPPPGAPIASTTAAPNVDGVDVDWIVSYDETYQPIVGTGLQKVAIVPDWTILGITHATTIASAGTGAQLDSADVQFLNLRINSQYFAPDGPYPAALFSAEQVYKNDVPLPLGVWMYDQDVLGRADWIFTDAVTEIESDIYINPAAVAATNPRIYTSVRRMIDKNPAAHLLAAG